MKYNFEQAPDRSRDGSVKWNRMPEGAQTLPMTVADMEFETAPEIAEGLAEWIRSVVLGYTAPTDEVLDAIVDWMRRRHDFAVEKEWIVPSPGVVPALFAAVRAFTEPGDGVIVMPPVYFPFYRAIESAGRRIEKNPLRYDGERYAIDYEGLEALCRKPNNRLLMLCSPHNPGGRVWTRDELERVSEIAARHDVIVASDEIHHDLVLNGHRHTVFATLSEDAANRCIVCTAPSKTFNLAGLVMSAILVPNPQLREALEQELALAGVGAVNAAGWTGARLAYQKGEAWLEELLRVVEDNEALLRSFLEEKHPAVRVPRIEGTYLAWVDCRGLGATETELVRALNEAGFYALPGSVFGEEGEGFLRINLALPKKELQANLERMDGVLSAFSSER